MYKTLFYTFNLLVSLASIFVQAEKNNLSAAWFAVLAAFWIAYSWRLEYLRDSSQ
jgi:membrane associated rhomboid family serine protease